MIPVWKSGQGSKRPRGLRRSVARQTVGGCLLIWSLASVASGADFPVAWSHYQRGQFLYDRHDLPAALKEFERAYALDRGPHRGSRVGMHFCDYDPEFQMLRIQVALGHWKQARRFLELCVSHGYTDLSENAEEFRRLILLVRSFDRSCKECRQRDEQVP